MSNDHCLKKSESLPQITEDEFNDLIAIDSVVMKRGDIVSIKMLLIEALNPLVHFNSSMTKMKQEADGITHEKIKSAIALLSKVD